MPEPKPHEMLAKRQTPVGRDWLTAIDIADLTPASLVQRVNSLKPLIASNAPRAEKLRRPVDEVWSALRASGIFYHFVPKKFGGLEFDVDTFIDAMLPIAEACASTGWVATFCVEHNWMLCQFPLEGQAEVFAKFPYIIAPVAVSPPGVAVPVNGGYRLSGRWNWGTGIMHADWVLLGALVKDESPPRMIMVLVPADEVEVIDVWQMSGMAGTGSNDILVRDALVPLRRACDFERMREGTAHGATLYSNPIYRMPMLPFLCLAAALPALGAARGAVESFRSYVKGRLVRGTDQKQQEKPALQMRLARAGLMTETAEELLRNIGRGAYRLAELRDSDVAQRIHMRAQGAYAVELSRDAVRILVEGGGASVHSLNNTIQRALRDITVIAGHMAFDIDAALEADGRALLGLAPNSQVF